MKTIKEKNKMIAEFMGYYDYKDGSFEIILPHFEGVRYCDQMRFHFVGLAYACN